MTAPVPTMPPPKAPAVAGGLRFKPINTSGGHRVVLYGPGGIGKTTLACMSKAPVAFFDLDDSLGRLLPQLQELGVADNIKPLDCPDWKALRDALRSPGWDGIGTIVIDSGTRAEELCVEHVINTIPHEKGAQVKIKCLDDYGWGKGPGHLFDAFLPLLADLDAHARQGRNVVMLCHDCVSNVPNPSGDDWIRYEPRLAAPKSGKDSIRLRVREWADHVLFYGYDVAVKDGKGKGGGTRTVYPAELPHCMAKSRTLRQPVPVAAPSPEFWELVRNGQQA